MSSSVGAARLQEAVAPLSEIENFASGICLIGVGSVWRTCKASGPINTNNLLQRRSKDMSTTTKLSGVAIAVAAASLFALAPVSSAVAAEEGTVHCYGVNACKGKGACATADNACGGQNACKGKGFIEATKEQCEELDGQVGD